MTKPINPILNLWFNLKKPSGKAPTGGDVGWMVDCEIAELYKFANLGHYLAKYPFPVGLGGGYVCEKIFFDLLTYMRKIKDFIKKISREVVLYRSLAKWSHNQVNMTSKLEPEPGATRTDICIDETEEPEEEDHD